MRRNRKLPQEEAAPHIQFTNAGLPERMLKFRDQVPSFRLPEAEPAAPLSKLHALYQQEIDRGHLSPDPAQRDVIDRLDTLAAALADLRQARKGGALSRIFGSEPASGVPKGLYIWGSVGRGKTMIWTSSSRPSM